MPQLIQCIFVPHYIRRKFRLNLRTLEPKGIYVDGIRRMITCSQNNMENIFRSTLLLHIFINSAKQHCIRNTPGIATFIIDFISAMELIEALSFNKLLDILPAGETAIPENRFIPQLLHNITNTSSILAFKALWLIIFIQAAIGNAAHQTIYSTNCTASMTKHGVNMCPISRILQSQHIIHKA